MKDTAARAGEPVAEVGDLLLSVRERVQAAGISNRAPLYLAPAPAEPAILYIPCGYTPFESSWCYGAFSTEKLAQARLKEVKTDTLTYQPCECYNILRVELDVPDVF